MTCAAIAFLSMVLSGCTSADPKLLKDSADKYNARQLDDAEDLASKYIAATPPGEKLDEAYYLRGLARFSRDNRAGAAADLREALSRTTRPDLQAKARRVLGNIEYSSSHWAEAQKHFEAALTAAQGTTHIPPAAVTEINYYIGVCLQAQGQWAKSQPYLQKAAASNDPALKEIKELAVIRVYATHYSLQFGAFKEHPNATALIAQLKTAGITASIDIQPRNGEMLDLVTSGSYSTYAEATAARDRLLPKYPLVAIVP